MSSRRVKRRSHEGDITGQPEPGRTDTTRSSGPYRPGSPLITPSPGNEGVIKLVADRTTGVLVGATSAGPHGGEVFGMLSTVIQAKIPIKDLQHLIYAYPTFYGGVGETLGAYGRGIGKVIDPDFAFDGFDFDF